MAKKQIAKPNKPAGNKKSLINEQVAEKMRALRGLLEACEPRVRQLLPDKLKSQSERFINRAMLFIRTCDQSERILACTDESIVESVLCAAEHGFSIDGHFAYIIPYGVVAQCQFDYKALIAKARRAGLIKSCRSQEVRVNDQFVLSEENGVQTYSFIKGISPRGEVIGAYSIIIFPDDSWQIAHLDIDDINRIRQASKSPDSPAWVKWFDRMGCKAAVKRNLNGIEDDPGLLAMIQADNLEYVFENNASQPVYQGKAASTVVSGLLEPTNKASTSPPMPMVIEAPAKETESPEAVDPKSETAPKQDTNKPPAGDLFEEQASETQDLDVLMTTLNEAMAKIETFDELFQFSTMEDSQQPDNKPRSAVIWACHKARKAEIEGEVKG